MQPSQFEVLYDATPEKIRSNANLSGQLVLPFAQLHAINKALQTFRDALIETGELEEDEFQELPLDYIIEPYLQLSRAEAMKGSEQTVRSMAGQYQGPEGVGVAPDLTPSRPNAQGSTVIIQNGLQRVTPKQGLGKRLINLGRKPG